MALTTVSGSVWDSNANHHLINVKDAPYSATGDGSTDDRAAIQSAIDALQATAGGTNKTLYFPEGDYVIASQLTMKDHSAEFTRFPITLLGDRGNREGPSVTITAQAGFSDAQMINFLDTSSGTGSNAYYDIQGIKLNGNSVAGLHGLTIPTMTAMTFTDFGAEDVLGRVVNITTTAVTLNFHRCHFISCGDRVLSFGGTVANDINIVDCEFSGATGWAIYFLSGTKVRIVGNTIQSCAKGGIYAANLRGFQIEGNRFEQNAQTTAHSYSTPSTGTIRADIHLNGHTTLDTNLALTSPCERGSISNNLFTASSITYHIFASAAAGIRIENNLAPSEDLLGTWGKTDVSYVKDLTVRANENDAGVVDLAETSEAQDITHTATFATDNALNPQLMHTYDFGLPGVNAVQPQQRFNMWVQQVAGGGFTFVRLAGLENTNPIWRLTNNGSTSDVVGVVLDLDDDLGFLRGRWVWFGLYRRLSTTTDNNIGLYTAVAGGSGTSAGHSTTATTGDTALRRFTSMAQFVASDDTTLTIGIRKLGVGTGAIDVCCPMVGVMGSPLSRMPQEDPLVYYGTAAPTAGAWRRGDRVWNTTPSAAGDPGFVCVTGGSPGTWKAMGDLDA